MIQVRKGLPDCGNGHQMVGRNIVSYPSIENRNFVICRECQNAYMLERKHKRAAYRKSKEGA